MNREEVRELLRKETERWWEHAIVLYGKRRIQGRPPTTSFELRGLTAGRACVQQHHNRYNLDIATANLEGFLAQTVPHEVAHIVDYFMHGCSSHHGKKWKQIMVDFGLEPTRCHNYEKGVEPTRTLKRFTYYCQCRFYELTSIRHNRIKRGASYSCRSCHFELTRDIAPYFVSGLKY